MSLLAKNGRQANSNRPQCTRKVTKTQAFNSRFSGSLKSIIWTFLAIVPLLLVIVGNQWINSPENLTIKSVEVTGDFKVLDKKQLQPIIEAYAKTNLFLLDSTNLEKDIESNPWVHSAALTSVWPDKLIVKIYEQKPVAHWGEKKMLAENGEIINATLENDKTLPLLYSPNDKGRNMASGFLKIRKMLQGFPIKLTEFKEDARGSWQIKLENGMTLRVGRTEQAKRIKRFMVAYEQSLNEVLDKISVVDLRYTNGFAVRWKKGLSANTVFKG